MKKYFVILLFIFTSSFVPCLKADAQEAKTVQAEQVVQVEQVIQDKSSLQNLAYYFVFTALFVAFAVWISRKSKWPYFKYFVAYNCAILLLSLICHLVVYNKKSLHIEIDHVGFYFKKRHLGNCYDRYDDLSYKELLAKSWNSIKIYSYDNIHYYTFSRFIRDVIFPEKNFFAAFFFAGLLNASLWIIGLFLFTETLLFMKCKSWYIVITLLLFSPDFIARNALPSANCFKSFILIFFLWNLVGKKNI